MGLPQLALLSPGYEPEPLPEMTKQLTKMTEPARHRLWAELAGDSPLESLRLATLGWVPRKRERLRGPTPRHAFCLLARGEGTFLSPDTDTPQPVAGPGIFFTSPAMHHDYGPTRVADRWEEFYWIIEGARVAEWEAAGWWPDKPSFRPIDVAAAEELIALFRVTSAALERRDRRALDQAKLALERWLCDHADPRARRDTGPASPLAPIVERWRREPQRAWSLKEGAAQAGLSYTRFRARFVEDYGTSPYDYLLRLRLELAAGWLRATSEPVKSIALRCGFSRVEPFVRAFGRVHGASPARWRRHRLPARTA